ncbi:MAG: hypothetical protein HY815_06275 [Candidatus Riflebacteria bacterium]|nr:hypothetical protein [Candidatus Riflebacteria bacterium]
MGTPRHTDLLYLLQLYWEHSIYARLVIFMVVAFAVFTVLIVLVEFGREALKRPYPHLVSHQLMCCWASSFVVLATLLAAVRILMPIPR